LLRGVLPPPLGAAQDLHRPRPLPPRGLAPPLLSDLGAALRRHAAVARALVAVRENAVRDALAFAREGGHGAARPELGVVGVRRNHHDMLNSFGHILSWMGSGPRSF